MAHAATAPSLDAAVPKAAGASKKRGFARTFLATLSALHTGIVASHRYEALRARGVPHTQAVDRAFAELGFGS